MGARTRKMAVVVQVIGDGAVGKTCLVDALLELHTDHFYEESCCYMPTSLNQKVHTWLAPGGDREFEIRDNFGVPGLEPLRKTSYPGTDILVVVFEMTEPDSLANVEDAWMPEAQHHLGDAFQDVIVVLVGTKYDLWDLTPADERVELSLVSAVADRIGAQRFILTSAKTGHGIQEMDQSGSTLNEILVTLASLDLLQEPLTLKVSQAVPVSAQVAMLAVAPTHPTPTPYDIALAKLQETSQRCQADHIGYVPPVAARGPLATPFEYTREQGTAWADQKNRLVTKADKILGAVHRQAVRDYGP